MHWRPASSNSMACTALPGSSALATRGGDGGSRLWIDAAAGRIRKMEHAIDQLESFPRVFRQAVELGELGGVPDAGQRSGQLHGVSGKQHGAHMRTHAIAHASGLAYLCGG